MGYGNSSYGESSYGGVGTYVGEKEELLHWEDVKKAYQNEQKSVMTLLLATFFESAVTSYLKDRYEGKIREYKGDRSNLGAGFIEDDSFSFSHKLQLARVTGEIEEDEYRIIDNIRDKRNKFAHDLESWKPEEAQINIEDLEEAIELYEDWLEGEGRSILDY